MNIPSTDSATDDGPCLLRIDPNFSSVPRSTSALESFLQQYHVCGKRPRDLSQDRWRSTLKSTREGLRSLLSHNGGYRLSQAELHFRNCLLYWKSEVGSKNEEKKFQRAIAVLRDDLEKLEKASIIPIDAVGTLQRHLEYAEYHALFLRRPTLNNAPIDGIHTIPAVRRFLRLSSTPAEPLPKPPSPPPRRAS